MDRLEVWDLYFRKLYSLIASGRKQIEKLIAELTRREFSRPGEEAGEEVIRAYAEAAVAFIDERLFSYGMDHADRLLHAVSRGIDPADVARAEASMDWYERGREKEEIDRRIECCLQAGREPEEIARVLVKEFGAYPDRSITRAYAENPLRNRVPDYVLSEAIERVVRDASGKKDGRDDG